MTSSLLSYETLVHAIAGATGSVIGMTAFYPLDTLRSRIQVEDSFKLHGTSLQLLIKLANEEGHSAPHFQHIFRNTWSTCGWRRCGASSSSSRSARASGAARGAGAGGHRRPASRRSASQQRSAASSARPPLSSARIHVALSTSYVHWGVKG